MSSQDRAFGRRAPALNTAPANPPRTSQPPDSNGPNSSSATLEVLNSRGVRQIAGIALGVAIVFVLIMFYVTGMKMAGRALDRHWAENAGYPALDNPPTSRVNAGSTYNELRTACLARAKTAGLSRAMERDLDIFTDIAVGERLVQQHATFIDCLITTQPGRFCRAEHRAHLASAIRDYFRLRLRVREEWMDARNNPFGLAATGLAPLPNTQGINAQYPSERTDPRIISGLAALIADGYLTRADLGAGMVSRMPGDLDEKLKGVERKKRSCG